MAVTIEQIKHDALTLPETERASLAHALLRSLESPADEGVEEAWDAEIARRLERVRKGAAHGGPAEEVFRDLRARRQE